MDLIEKLRDSVTPEEDPISEQALDARAKESLQHIAHNSSRAFFWKELAQYSLTTMAIFGGIAIGGAAVMSAGTALAVAGGAGLIGLTSSLIAHRIDLKNEVSLEELHAKRTGQSVAESIQEKAMFLEQMLQKEHLPVGQSAAHHIALEASRQNLHSSDAPGTRISAEQATGELLQPPTDRVLH